MGGVRLSRLWRRMEVRPAFPTVSAVNEHVRSVRPDLWEEWRNKPAYAALLAFQEAGLISGVVPGARLDSIRLIQS